MKPAGASVLLTLRVSLQDQEELEQLLKVDNDTRHVVRELQQKVDEAKSSLSSNRSRGKVLDALMQLKKSGKIPGIYGRLVKKRRRSCLRFTGNLFICLYFCRCSYICFFIITMWVFTSVFFFGAGREILEPSMKSTMWPFRPAAALWTTSWWTPSTRLRNASLSSKSKISASPLSSASTR